MMVYKTEEGWYWTLLAFSRPIGPFKTWEEANEDFHAVMGVPNGV